MIRIVPFGASSGFSDQAVPGTHYYSQGFSPSLMGAATMYSIVNQIASNVVTGGTMGTVKHFAVGPSGARFAQDDNGNILKENTPGVYDFSIVRAPGGNGAGLLGDQYGNLLYATPTALGLYDGVTWTDSYQSLSSTGPHPMDTYEDLRLVANGANLAVLYSDNSWNSAAFSLPSAMQITAVKAGPTGILMGANFGYQGAIVLWDGISPRSKTPWKWFNGQILSIAKYGENWIVLTQRGAYLTNGYTVRELFGVFDDPLAFRSYENTTVLPQRTVVVNDLLVFANPIRANGPMGYEFGKLKPGFYLYSLSRKSWNYIPVATGNTISVDAYAVFVDVSYNNRIFVSYKDRKTNLSYIATLTNTPPSRAQIVSEALGIGRPHYQRTYFGPTEKVAEAVILNLNVLAATTEPITETFSVALKLYNFKRQLWGRQVTNAQLSNKAQVQVDGTDTYYTKAQSGDEVTVMAGANAGQIAHITAIANQGTNTETWTLDTTLSNQTESGVYLQVQPFKFIGRMTFNSLSDLKNIYFNTGNSYRGKQFLAKVVLENIGTNLSLELDLSYFVFDDLSYDQT